jgi:hypothetical protein
MQVVRYGMLVWGLYPLPYCKSTELPTGIVDEMYCRGLGDLTCAGCYGMER